MGEDEDEDRCTLRRLGQVSLRVHVLGELGVGQVLDVHVRLVDNVCEVLAIDLLLVDPHVDLGLEEIMARRVRTNDARDGRSPVAGADDANLLGSHDSATKVHQKRGTRGGVT